MTVLRINKKKRNFLILDKTCLAQTNLSWGAKGLHAYLMGLSDDIRIKVDKLIKKSTNGRDSVRTLLNELKKAGYITTEWVRNESSGKFNGFEYIVHEIPQASSHELIKLNHPETKKPSAVEREPEIPATGNPLPEKPSAYISINNTNKEQEITNIEAAVKGKPLNESMEIENGFSAAAFSLQDKQRLKANSNQKPENHLLPIDVVISDSLTDKQRQRINAMIRGLQEKTVISNPETLSMEVKHCILSQSSFTACGRDFVRKLNAIRAVILKGEWQTPADMVIQTIEKARKSRSFNDTKLQSAIAELNHFQKMFSVASPNAKAGIEELVAKAQAKVALIEVEIGEKKDKAPLLVNVN